MSTTIVTASGKSRLVRPDEVPPIRCFDIDAPWPEKGGGKIKRGADRHYKVMKPWQIIETIIRSPLWRPDRENGCHLWLWITNNSLAKKHGHMVAEALGFRVLTFETWRKDRIGIGQYLRGETEHIMLCVDGPTCKPKPGRKPPSTFLEAKRGRHSEKPPESIALMERVSPGPRAELFAREPRDGWWQWGNDPALARAAA